MKVRTDPFTNPSSSSFIPFSDMRVDLCQVPKRMIDLARKGVRFVLVGDLVDRERIRGKTTCPRYPKD